MIKELHSSQEYYPSARQQQHQRSSDKLGRVTQRSFDFTVVNQLSGRGSQIIASSFRKDGR